MQLILFVGCIVLIVSLVLLTPQERIYKYGGMNLTGPIIHTIPASIFNNVKNVTLLTCRSANSCRRDIFAICINFIWGRKDSHRTRNYKANIKRQHEDTNYRRRHVAIAGFSERHKKRNG